MFYRLYRGLGSLDAVDFSSPVAQFADHDTPLLLPDLDWSSPADSRWFLVLRAVDDQGHEFADPAAVCSGTFTAAGQFIPGVPDRVRHLRAAPVAGSRVILTWSTDSDGLSPAATEFRVFLSLAQGHADADLIAAQPDDTVSADDCAFYSWTSPAREPGAWRVAVQPVAASGQPGPAAFATVVVLAPVAVAPATLLAEIC